MNCFKHYGETVTLESNLAVTGRQMKIKLLDINQESQNAFHIVISFTEF